MDYSSTTIQAENNLFQQQLQPFDVLCGRDKQCYNNIGNRRFRILINCNLPRYLECESRNKRSGIIVALTQELCCVGGTCGNSSSASSRIRFFKRQGKKGTCDDANSLIELGFKQCREKIGHALRDAASQHNNSIKSQEAIIEKNRQNESQKELNEQRTEEANILNNFDNENTTVNGNLGLEVHPPNNSHQFSIQMLHGLREKVFHVSPSLPLTNNSNDFLNNIDNKYTTLNHNLQPNRRSHRFSRMMFNSISEELLEVSSLETFKE
jgi:hypothetical protein